MMRTALIARVEAMILATALVAVPAAPGRAARSVWVPVGTAVGLRFLTPVASDKIDKGTKVKFKVTADILRDRHVVVRAGASTVGTVIEATKPGMFGQDARVVIGALAVNGVDGKPIKLSDLIVSKATISKGRAGAAAASVAGMVLLGPIGLLGGALVRGDNVAVPAGTVVAETTKAGVFVRVP